MFDFEIMKILQEKKHLEIILNLNQISNMVVKKSIFKITLGIQKPRKEYKVLFKENNVYDIGGSILIEKMVLHRKTKD